MAKEITQCRLCDNRSCYCPEPKGRFILKTTWEGDLSIPTEFLECSEFERVINHSKDIFPLKSF